MPKFNPTMLPDLTGKVIIVTGGNSGIGKATVTNLVKKHAKVYIASRDLPRILTAIAEIQALVPSATLLPLILDLCDFSSIQRAAALFTASESHLHVLLNNAGVATLPYSLTVDGYDAQWSANYMGHHLLTKLLLPTLIRTAATAPDPVRIVNMSSELHSMAPKAGILFDNINQPQAGLIARYAHAKLANVLHTKALAARYGGRENNLIVAAVHPGVVETDLATGMFGTMVPGVVARCLSRVLLTPVEEGCWTSVYVAAGSDVRWEDNGAYFVPVGKKGKVSACARDEALAERLWVWAEEELARKGY